MGSGIFTAHDGAGQSLKETKEELILYNLSHKIPDQASRPMSSERSSSRDVRRSFLKRAMAVLLAGMSCLIPLGAGIWVFFHPLRRRRDRGSDVVEITHLSALPADGRPRQFPVISTRRDAWTRHRAVAIGAVYLKRTGKDNIVAFKVVCPHLGCFVRAREDGSFACPCHESEFDQDGNVVEFTRSGRRTVSPRGLDTLEVRIAQGKVYVRFESFMPARPEKIAI